MKRQMYELSARYDARKSFYGKAMVEDLGNGNYNLFSYGTLVSTCKNGVVEELGKWSQTATRHQKEFGKQFAV